MVALAVVEAGYAHNTQGKHGCKHNANGSIVFGLYVALYPGDGHGSYQAGNYGSCKKTKCAVTNGDESNINAGQNGVREGVSYE